jgi:DNA polymerase elongation subunit (family B)
MSKRAKNHYLNPNGTCDSPSNILLVDTEAKIEYKDGLQYQTFRLGYAIHMIKSKKKWFIKGYQLDTVNDFWELLDKVKYDKKKLYIFAHNMAYDYTILKLDTYLSKRHLEITMRVIDSVFIIKADNVVFLSSTNFYKQSLKELGKIFNIEKLELPNFENCTDEELMTYCIRDVNVLFKIIEKHINFILDNDLGCFKPTIAGQAITAYKHRFMPTKLLVHNYEEILKMEKDSYRGGRCEAFKLGDFKDVYYLDINSMYPYVMRNNDYPTRLVSSKIITNPTLNDLNDALNDNKFVLADCNLTLNNPIIGVKQDKLLFPIGKIRQTITSPEIEYLISNPRFGKIENINKMVTYHKSNIFTNYVDYFYYNVRMKATNNADRTLAKLLLNSLYGKFGQHKASITTIVTDDDVIKMCNAIMSAGNTFEFLSNKNEKYIKLGDEIYHITQKDDAIARDSIPIIASTVTSYARIMLYSIIDKAGSDNVLYCDTDSVFVNIKGYDNLSNIISDTELGKLKIEDSGTCKIFGVKDYVFNQKVKLKGIKHNAELLPDGTYKQNQFQTKNKRYSRGTKDGIVIVEPIIKKLSREYTKGIVKDNIISPYVFNDF